MAASFSTVNVCSLLSFLFSFPLSFFLNFELGFVCLFSTSFDDDYYTKSKHFERVLDFFQSHATISRLEDSKGKRSLLISGVTTIKKAIGFLQQMR